MNAHQTMYITSPEYDSIGQMIFRDNNKMMIEGKNVLILNGSVTTGETLSKAVNSVLYYGGKITGIAAIFSAVTSVAKLPVHAVFEQKDIPDYGTHQPHSCPLCAKKQKIDAIVSGYGYSRV